MNVWGLVTARGGSKGFPNKNMHPLCGKPMILWTLEAAGASKLLSEVLVSTDHPAIADLCRDAGYEVPFIRPSSLAQDDTPHGEVIHHALEWRVSTGRSLPEYLLLLQPTSPLRTAGDIDGAIELARERDADAVVSVCETRAHPEWMKIMDGSGKLKPFLPGGGNGARRQDLSPVYVLNGALYLMKSTLWLRHKTFHVEGALGFIMPRERSVDVDDYMDAALCDLLLRNRPGAQGGDL